jgi:hypothetical protein
VGDAVKTVVVVGNGPSLNETPLVDLKGVGHTMIGVNKIHLRYDQDDWRPDHWVMMDRSNSNTWDLDILKHLGMGYPCWVREDLTIGRGFVTHHHIKLVRQCEHVDTTHTPASDWHLDHEEHPICQQGGSVPAAVQIALKHLGAERIVLVGCDMGFKGNAENHFIKGYIDTDFFDNHKAIAQEANLKHVYAMAERACQARGVELLNGTIGGHLNLLPRISIDHLFT